MTPTKGDKFNIIQNPYRVINQGIPGTFVKAYSDNHYLLEVVTETGAKQQRSFYTDEIKAII